MKISVSDTGLNFIKDLKSSKKEEKVFNKDVVSEEDSEKDSSIDDNSFPNFIRSRK